MKIQMVREAADIAKCMQLRAEVFIDEQNVPENDERDGLDDQCVHFLATIGLEAVGAARLSYHSKDYAKLQRVCVKKSSRDAGIGAKIIRAMIEQVRVEGKRTVIRLGSQTHALTFYRKLGFEAFGDEYMDAGIPHYDMEFRL